MKAVVVIGDIVRSSAIPDRDLFQQRFQSVVESLNDRWGGYLSPYTVTLGDEYQAVYSDAAPVMDHTFALIAGLRPHQLRVCIAVGAITTKLNHERAIGMDGPAFHMARLGIDELRESGETMCVRSAGHDVGLEDGAVRLIGRLTRDWHPTRWRVLRELSLARRPSEIASELSISPTAVYKNIRDGGLELIRACGREVGLSLTAKAGGGG